jgi:hypothetical protein
MRRQPMTIAKEWVHTRRRGCVAAQAWESLVTTQAGRNAVGAPPRGHARRQASKSTWRLLPGCLVAALAPTALVPGCRTGLPRNKRERERGLRLSHHGRKHAPRIAPRAGPATMSDPACQAGSAPISARAQSCMHEQAGERTCGLPYMCLIHDIKQDTSGYWASTPPSHSYLTACSSIAGGPRPRTRDVELEEGSRNPLSDLMATVIPQEAGSRPRNHPIPAPTDRCYPRHTKATPGTAVTPARDAPTHAFGWP